MKPKDLDLFKFKKMVDAGKPFLVKFKSDDCPVCTDIEQLYEDVSLKFKELDFCEVDIDEEEELAELFVEEGVPTIYYIKGQKFHELVYPESGFDEASLTEEIKRIQGK